MFNPDTYRVLLKTLIGRGYRWGFFTRDAIDPSGAPPVWMRHDIDFDTGYARRLAEIEADEGARATYFFHLRGTPYNVLSGSAMSDLAAILAAGHRVSLHVDPELYGDNLPIAINRELALFRTAIAAAGIEVPDTAGHGPAEPISFHRPVQKRVFGKEIVVPWGVTHTYENRFLEHSGLSIYFSDSGGSWGSGDPTESVCFREGYPLQILTHPIWWIEEGTNPREKLQRAVIRRNLEMTEMIRTWKLATVIDDHALALPESAA
jgi:hypothetical protein